MRELLPKKFIEKYKILLGDDAESFFESFDQEPEYGFDINKKKNKPEFNQEKISWNFKFGRRGKISGKSIEHITGVVYSQEPSAQYVGNTINVQPGEKILDAAAAPGGKTIEILNSLDNDGFLISNEFISKRAKILSENIERMGENRSIVTSHDLSVFADKLPGYFDKVLLDAPCSGEGMFRKDPKGIEYWNEEYSLELAKLQKSILKDVVKTLKPGGELIYSTCTFAPEENEQIISWLVDEYPEFSIEPLEMFDGFENGRPEWGDGNKNLKKTVRIWPHKVRGEGHFVAKLKKLSMNESETKQIPELSSNLNQNQIAVYKKWEKDNINIEFKNLFAFGDFIYSFPEGTPNIIREFKILRLGTQLGEVKRDRFIPSHSLAIALKKDDAIRSIELNDHQWKDYIHGDVFSVNSENGWTLMLKNNNPVGWGKNVQGVIKNFYPKAFRFEIKNPE